MCAFPIRGVVLDAAGTLVFPKKSVGSQYAEALRAHGVDADAVALEKRFSKTFRAVRAGKPYPDSEDAERAFWRAVVRGTLADACPPALLDEVFDGLFKKFGTGAAWRVAPDAFAALSALRFLGIRLVLLSNSDRRMRVVLDDLGLAPFFEKIVLSAETGFPKPDKRAFAAAVNALGLAPGEVLHVGDSREEDAAGALSAGLRACWLTPDKDTLVSGAYRAATLTEVVGLVRGEAVGDNERAGFRRPVRNLIADLRGLPEETTRSVERPMSGTFGITDLLRRARDGDAAALRGVSELARGVIGAEEKDMDARGMLLDSWSSIITPRLRGKCFPVDVDRDALVVLCTTPVARNELKFVERALITAVRRLPGCSGVNKIAYRM